MPTPKKKTTAPSAVVKKQKTQKPDIDKARKITEKSIEAGAQAANLFFDFWDLFS